jgi:hypothetical protein
MFLYHREAVSTRSSDMLQSEPSCRQHQTVHRTTTNKHKSPTTFKTGKANKQIKTKQTNEQTHTLQTSNSYAWWAEELAL